MVTKEFSEACTEINEIFKFISREELEKIPMELKEFLRNNIDESYNFKVDITKQLDSQPLKRETKDILVYLYTDYWCPESEKEELKKIFRVNYEKEQLELRKKYNPEDIFKKRQNEITDNETMIIKYKESIFKRIIKKIFRKK